MNKAETSNERINKLILAYDFSLMGVFLLNKRYNPLHEINLES